MQPPITITASEFKAKCLKLMDEVAETGRPVLITKHGKPMARLVPDRDTDTVQGSSLRGALKGWMTIKGDIISPLEDVKWNVLDDDHDPLV